MLSISGIFGVKKLEPEGWPKIDFLIFCNTFFYFIFLVIIFHVFCFCCHFWV